MATVINSNMDANKKCEIYNNPSYLCFFINRIKWLSLFDIYNSITFNYLINNSTFYISKIFSIFMNLTITCIRISNTIFLSSLPIRCLIGLFHSYLQLLLFPTWFELLFLASNLDLEVHNICLINVFDTFTLVIRLNIS